MRDVMCSVCNETVIEQIARRALNKTELSSKKAKSHNLCFFGHLCERQKLKLIIPHLICEECNPLVKRHAFTQDTPEKCIVCNEIPNGDDWKEQYTWNKHTKTFEREPASSYIEESEEMELELKKIEQEEKRSIEKAQSNTIGALTALFITIATEAYRATTPEQKLTLQNRISLIALGSTLGIFLAMRALSTNAKGPCDVAFGKATGSFLITTAYATAILFFNFTAEKSIDLLSGAPLITCIASGISYLTVRP